ncbi:MAG: glycoside hydrolase family 5 protein [Cytophagaceae bacterium]|jgi:endoglucanase|nr:glycoside hydrolase family 5 protein [Cytophagaceae bacterium]
MFLKRLLFIIISIVFISGVSAQSTIVEKYGQLTVKGTAMVSATSGDTVQLVGMSLFWSQWMGQFYNASMVKTLRDDWKATVVRAAMGVEMGGYSENPAEELIKIREVVDACIAKGIYVIIDYHSHEAHKNPEMAKKFFAEMAKRYGTYPNVLYEIYNEPLQYTSWNKDIKPYAEQVIAAIRTYDPDNIVIVGTRQWSQKVTEAAINPIADKNTMYTLHFYAGTHKQWLRDEAKAAMEKGIALFVTEYGTCDASGNNNYDPVETQLWFEFLDQYKISYCNWSIADKDETASALKPGSNAYGGWSDSDLTESGLLVKENMIMKNKPIFDTLVKNEKVKVNKEKKKK